MTSTGFDYEGSNAESTRVFRIPTDDVTAPDLMRSAPCSSPVLTIVKGPQIGASFELTDPVVTVGRDPANGIFLNDMTVSRSHARIVIAPEGASVEDLGSLNGTWVDGAIVNNAPLHDGSSLQIGTFTLVYHENPSAPRIETGE